MSEVTEAILYVDRVYDDDLQRIIERMSFTDDQCFNLINTKSSGGHKVFIGEVYIAAFNYVDFEELTYWFNSLPDLDFGTTIVLIAKNEHSSDILYLKRSKD